MTALKIPSQSYGIGFAPGASALIDSAFNAEAAAIRQNACPEYVAKAISSVLLNVALTVSIAEK